MLALEMPWFHAGVLVIDLLGAVLIVGYVVAAWFRLLQGRGVDRARLMVAEGAILGLSLKTAASLLKTLELHTWQQILMFATIFALRTVLKQLFMWEQRHAQVRGQTS